MKLLYQGVDTLDFAVRGAFAPEELARLRDAKSVAAKQQSCSLTEIGRERRPVHVNEMGRRGGYAFTFHTGPLGAVYAVKDNPDPGQWNIFVSIRALTLASHTYEGARDFALTELQGLGCRIETVSVGRIDYAMDFLTSDFSLDPSRFVAHPHARLKPHWSATDLDQYPEPMAIFRGRRVESVTIGKMPGRQVIVYDKRYAAIQKRELFWFDVWKIDRNDPLMEVWRVEVRAGKRELKERWQVTTFDALELAFGDVIRETLQTTRYHAANQTDSNVSRQQLDPLWLAATEAAETGLKAYTNGLSPSRALELERNKAISNYKKQVIGNLGGLAVALDIEDADFEYELPSVMAEMISEQLKGQRSSLRRSASRARDRLHFIQR